MRVFPLSQLVKSCKVVPKTSDGISSISFPFVALYTGIENKVKIINALRSGALGLIQINKKL